MTTTTQLRDRLRSFRFATGQIKSAELGGGQDGGFEVAFSNLAHSYVKDKAPKLLDYEVGFQLIEKSQDNTRAVGVIAFKISSQWLFIPVFFLNGDLKGHELLYLKSQDAFVPLKENWINHILNKKPGLLGDEVDTNMRDLGVLQPSLSALRRSPHKWASAPPLAGWARDFLPTLARLATTPPAQDAKYENLKGPLDLLKEAGAPLFRYFVEKIGAAYPGLLQACDGFYGPDALTETARHLAHGRRAAAFPSLFKRAAAPRPRRWPQRPVGAPVPPAVKASSSIFPSALHPSGALPDGLKHDVVVRTTAVPDPDLVHDLSADEKQTLLREHIVLRDRRADGETTIAYAAHGPLRLYNPDHTGLYYVLIDGCRFEKMLVVMAPHGRRGREKFCTVVRLEGQRSYVNAEPAAVWVRAECDDEEWRRWLAEQPDADAIPLRPRRNPWKDRRRFVLVGPVGQGAAPLQVAEEYEAADGSKTYDVDFDVYVNLRRPRYPDSRHGLTLPTVACGPCENVKLVLTGKPGGIRLSVNRLQVPSGFKRILCRDAARNGENAEREPFRLGALNDVSMALLTETTPLTIAARERRLIVNDRDLDEKEAMAHLFFDHGLRKEAAAELIDRARREGKCEVRLVYSDYVKACWGAGEKQAAPMGNLIGRGPSSPFFPEEAPPADNFMNDSVPAQEPLINEQPVPELSSGLTDREQYNPSRPDAHTMRAVQEAARTGQREVFDTALLGGLLKVVRQDNLVDRYLGDLMKGLDRLGRILFLFYWHKEAFEDRYGKQDTPELEDGLRNAFEGMGDIVLALKQKAIEPDDPGDVDLGAIAHQ